MGLVRAYQLVISPLLGPTCRFCPSCSVYTSECLRLHGPLRGSYLGLRRILRCHPFDPGGYDPPPLPRLRDVSESSSPTAKADRSLH